MDVYGIGNHGQNSMYGNSPGGVSAYGKKETAGKAVAEDAGSRKYGVNGKTDTQGNVLDVFHHPEMQFTITFPFPVDAFAILRREKKGE